MLVIAYLSDVNDIALNHSSYMLYFAKNIDELNYILELNSIDILLIKLNNSLNLAKTLKKLYPKLPQIAILKKNFLVEAVEFGFCNYLIEPLNYDRLLEIVAMFDYKFSKNIVSKDTKYDLSTIRDYVQNSLKDSEDKYRLLTEISPDLIILHSKDSIVYINSAGAKILGIKDKRKILNKKDLASFITPNQREQFLNSFKSLNIQIQFSEYKLIKEDGHEVYVELSTIPLTYKGQKFVQILAHDLTKRKIVELEREKISKQLKELNRNLEARVKKEVIQNREREQIMFAQARYAQMGEMLNMIAHQWRQPLTAISVCAIDLALNIEFGDFDTQKVIDSSKYIEEQTQKMSNIINDFMNFFKPGREKENFLIDDVISDIYRLMSAQLKNRDIEFINLVDKNLKIKGYKKELEQVLINLIANARDAYDGLDVINRDIIIETKEFENFYIISVADKAGGVPTIIQDRIFEPYFTTKEQGKGTGIGLYMSKNIIERNFKGSISLDCINGGSTFKIKIPKE